MKLDCHEYLHKIAAFFNVNYNIVVDRYLEIRSFQPERWGGGTVEPAVAQMLYIIPRIFHPSNVVEIGSNQGYSTWFIARAIKEIHKSGTISDFTSIDIDSEALEIAKDKCQDLPVTFYQWHSQSIDFHYWLEAKNPDFVFLDASHEYQDTIYELKSIRNYCRPGTIIALHDIFSDGVSRALEHFSWNKRMDLPTQPNTGFGLIKL